VRDAFFAARSYTDVADLNRQADGWCQGASADRKWIEDKSRTVRDAFDDERGRLLPLPAEPFPAHERVEVEIGKTPYARFDLNDYSVPHDRTQRSLTVLADLATVRIVEGQDDVVAVHARCWDRGQQLEVSEHLDRLAAEMKRAREHRGLDRLAKAAPSSSAFLRCLADRGQNLGSNTSWLLQLLDADGADALEDALVEVLERDTIHIGTVRQVLDRRRSERGLPPPACSAPTRRFLSGARSSRTRPASSRWSIASFTVPRLSTSTPIATASKRPKSSLPPAQPAAARKPRPDAHRHR
jgi:hypothetical protein